jgi:putative phosphotransacetylase
MTMAVTLDRAAVERVVREVLGEFRKGRDAVPPDGVAWPLKVHVSARHVHLCPGDFETLFGKGAKLTSLRPLYQEGHFAAAESVTIIGPKSRLITGLRILGPLRKYSQVELAYTDVVLLGIEKVPVRMSGDIEGTPGAWLMGPAGMLELKQGVIRAVIHAHMSDRDAARFGVADKDIMELVVEGDAPVIFGRVHVRVDPSYKLEVHLDTDEANACHLASASRVSLRPAKGKLNVVSDIFNKGVRA